MTDPSSADRSFESAQARGSDPAKQGRTDAGEMPRPGTGDAVVSNLALAAMFGDYLKEKRSARRWRIFFRLVWMTLFAVFAYFALETGHTPSSAGVPHTAVVEIKGEIADGTDAGASAIVGAVRDAFEDSHSMAVVLLINSPGGSPVQAGIINDEIRRMKDIYKKPVYAVVEESCASAAYYIAVSADKIYVDKASVVGSIGVLMDGFGFTGLMEKVGVERRLMTAGSNKGFLDPFSPQSKEHRDYAQNLLNQIHSQFIDVVRKGRGDRLKEDADTFSGLFWSGEQAVKLGLADEVANIEYVAREVVKAPDIYDYTRKENVAERLAKKFGASIGAGAVKAMASHGVLVK
jgi:protease-4